MASVPGSAPKAPTSPIAEVPGSQRTPPGKQVVLGGNGGLQPQCSTRPALPALLVPEELQRSRVKTTHSASPVACEPVCRVRVLLVGSRHLLGPPRRELSTLTSQVGHLSSGQPVRICVQIPWCSLGSHSLVVTARFFLSSQLEGKCLQGGREPGPNPVFPTSLLCDLKQVSKCLWASVLICKNYFVLICNICKMGLGIAPYSCAFTLED